MESKLRNEKVVDLKKILNGAKITIPAKANKAELIQTILKSKDALAYYETMKGDGSGEASAVGTPVPVAATPVVHQTDAGHTSATTPKDDDLLAPLEEFDWTTGQTTATSEPTSTKSAHTPSKAKPPPQTKVTPTATEGASPAASASSVAPAAPLDPEEEAKRKRAERFGITYIPPKPKDATKPKPAATKKDTSATTKPQATNGKASVGAKPSEDVGKLKGRAERFGISTKSKPTTADASLGQKRSAPVDPEEEERRRKRAERFGLPVHKAAPAETEEDERKHKRAERFGSAAAT